MKETALTEEQLKELAKLQEQKAQLERLLEQQRRVRACSMNLLIAYFKATSVTDTQLLLLLNSASIAVILLR